MKIGFLQLNNGFSGQHYLPLAVGMLASQLRANPTIGQSLEITVPEVFFGDNNLIAGRLAACDIVAASVYVWNEQNTLDICKRVRAMNPNALIVLGGPQVPNAYKQFRRIRTTNLSQQERTAARILFTEDYHRAHPYIDFCVHGEGERAFTLLVERFILGSKDACFGLPSVSGIDREGKFVFSFVMPRMNSDELKHVPSPLLDGFFDSILAAHPDQRWNLMYETDRGCPYQCTYCDWGGATEDKLTKFELDRVEREIEWIGSRSIEYVFLANANFGIIERDVEIAEFFVRSKAKYGFPKALSTQNAKNPKPHTIRALKVLEAGGLNKATVMSQQSLSLETLKHVRRDNMRLDEYYKIQADLGSQGIFTMTDLIFPMPGETKQSFFLGIDTLVDNGQLNRIQFNNLSILINTEMGNPEYQKKFDMRLTQVPIINPHGGRILHANSVSERQTLVTGTASMPEEDWLEVRSVSWLVNFLFFNKLAQLPILLLSEITGLKTTQVIRQLLFFSDHSSVLSRAHQHFQHYAMNLQSGLGNEFIHSPEFLDIYWPPDEIEYIKVVAEGKLNTLYRELLTSALRFFNNLKSDSDHSLLIKNTFDMNQFLMIVPAHLRQSWSLNLENDVFSWYRAKVRGEVTSLQTFLGREVSYRIPDRSPVGSYDLTTWCEKVVWYGNRQGAYIHSDITISEESLVG